MSVTYFPTARTKAATDRPDWVIDVLIDLVDYANCTNMPRLEEALAAAIEAALADIQKNSQPAEDQARPGQPAMRRPANVVHLDISAHRNVARAPAAGLAIGNTSGAAPWEKT